MIRFRLGNASAFGPVGEGGDFGATLREAARPLGLLGLGVDPHEDSQPDSQPPWFPANYLPHTEYDTEDGG